jgi:4-amino-4-deoxy-L-arabinose transferase-like glycosyltransferase
MVLVAVSALSWRIGSYPLFELDEGRNTEVAREMARGGDFVLPHLDGLPYLDKPALYFAAVALCLRAFGESEAAARLPSLLFTVGTLALVFALGRRFASSLAGAFAALALATMPLVAAYGRTVIFDSALAFFETLALYAAWRALEGGPRAGNWGALFWAALGLGALTKGPVAIVVPLLVLGAFALAARASLRPLFRRWGWPWLLVIALPWLVAVSLRRPDFPSYAFVDESLRRFTTTASARTGPFWYFLPIALGGSAPWIAPALAGGLVAWRRRSERKARAARPAVFVLAWALAPLIFFSLSESKLPGYYLPALPAYALAAALVLDRSREDTGVATLVARAGAAAAVLLLLLALALPIWDWLGAMPQRLTAPYRAALSGFVPAFATALAVAGVLALVGARRRSPITLAVGLALPVVALSFGGTHLLDAIGHRHSSVDLAAAIDRAAPGARIVGARAYPTSLRFYLDRPVLLSTYDGGELTSNYVTSRIEEFRARPGSPLRSEDWWHEAADRCEVPTVFVAYRGSVIATALETRLPLIATGGANAEFAAYGPCVPQAARSASSHAQLHTTTD